MEDLDAVGADDVGFVFGAEEAALELRHVTGHRRAARTGDAHVDNAFDALRVHLQTIR